MNRMATISPKRWRRLSMAASRCMIWTAGRKISSAGLRLRYFGPRALTQDDSVHSQATTLVYGDLGYKLSDSWTVGLDVFNMLDTKSSDIDYYYPSLLKGETLPAGGINDIHTHPSEPREFRISVTRTF